MGKWLDELRSHDEESPPRALTKLTEAPFVSFVSGSGRDFPQNQATGQPTAEAGVLAQKLHQALRQAGDWQDLDAILERAQAAYERGELLQAQVEALAIEAAALGRVLPQKAVYDGPVVWAADLLAGAPCGNHGAGADGSRSRGG